MKTLSGLASVLGLCLVLSSSGATAAAVPTLTSNLTSSGALQVGSVVSICVSASDPQGLPLTITYNYGDGTGDTLGKHIYSAAGVYPVTVTISNGTNNTTVTLQVTINEIANIWIRRQKINADSGGAQSWQAKYIYNADRTLAKIFNPATDNFLASLGTIPIIQITSNGNGSQHFSGSKPRFVFRSARGVTPVVSVILNEKNQTITINAKSETFTDKVPGVFHNMTQMGANRSFVDQAFDANGKFTANSGYRSTAFVVSAARMKVSGTGRDLVSLGMLLGDPAFVFPGASGAKTVRIRVTNVMNQIVLDKDLTQNVTETAGKLKSSATPSGRFYYDSKTGNMTFGLSRTTLTGLATSEEYVRVDVTIGDQTYSTHVTLFTSGCCKSRTVYSTTMPNRFCKFIPGNVADTTAPTVLSTVPANFATGVAGSTPITVTFSEAMNPATITTATITLQQGTTAVPGALTFTGNTATFTPSSTLPLGTTIIATVTTGATDLSGNALACNYVWTFTTGASIGQSAVSAAQSTVIATPLSVLADGVTTSMITVALKDANNNPVSGKTVTLAMTSGPGAPAISVASGASDASGVVAFIVSSTTVGANVFSATDVTDNSLLITQTATVNFMAGAVSASKSTVTATPLSVLADGMTTSTITVTLTDGNNRPIFGQTVTLAKSSGPGSPVISAASGPSDASGVVTFTVKSATGGADVFTATDVTDSNLVITQTATVTFTPGTVSAVKSTVSANPLSVVADGATTSTISVTLNDANNNPVSGKTVSLSKSSGSGAPVIGIPSGPSDAFGVVTFTVSSTTTGADAFAATDVTDGNLLINQTATVTFTLAPVPLNAIAPFGTFGGGAGMTNQGIFTVVNGDIGTTGASTTVTGFHDQNGDIYTETPLNIGTVNGNIDTAPPTPGGAGVGGNASTFAIATQAASDALTAYNNLKALPSGGDPGAGQLGGLTLAPGVYTSAGGTFQILGTDLTLDAQGDANAVWVFQMASSLTVGGPGAPRSVILINGAQAKNVFWQVGSAATINGAGGGIMVGTIIASAGVTFSTAGNVTITTLNGRAIGLNASTTLVNTVINVPGP